MIDLTTENGRIVSAALGLAAEKPWADVTLGDIADRAGTSLVALKTLFSSRGGILAEFTRLVDDETLRRAPRRGEGQTPRDLLFEVIMSRFDVLEPWKGALKSIARSALPEPGQIVQGLASQGWMLEAAGINSSGIEGGVRTAGLATVYASVFRAWLEDDDPGLARTMAALDRRLRRGQRTLERVEDVVAGVARTATSLADIVRGGWRPRQPSPKPDTEPPAAPAAPPGSV